MKRLLSILLAMAMLMVAFPAPFAAASFFFTEEEETEALENAPPEDLAQTEAPTQEEPEDEELVLRYGKTNTKGVNMRRSANSKSNLVLQVKMSGTEVVILEEDTTTDSVTWYKVLCEGELGYIRNDLLDLYGETSEEHNAAKAKYEADTMEYLAEVEKAATSSASGSGAGKSSGSSSGSGSSSTSSGSKVYVTSGGKSYHRSSSCSNMSSPRSITLEEAQNSGRKPCSKCW